MTKFIVDNVKENDTAQILNVLESSYYGKDISVLVTRRPDPIKSYMNDGENIFLSVLRDTEKNKIVAMGCCVIRKAFINGKIMNTGYLTGFKKLPDYHGKPPYISELFNHIYKNTKSYVDIYYDAISKSNFNARKRFEKSKLYKPDHNFVGEFTEYIFSNLNANSMPQYTLKRGLNEKLIKYYETEMPKYNFSPINIDLYNINNEDFYYLCDINNNILASCVLWNQKEYKQIIVKKYNLSKIDHFKLGYTNVPNENEPANFSYLSLFFVKDNNIEIADYFIKMVCSKVKEYDYLIVGFYENHPLNEVFKKIDHIKGKSRIYTVNWDNTPDLDDRFFYMDPGLF